MNIFYFIVKLWLGCIVDGLYSSIWKDEFNWLVIFVLLNVVNNKL